MFILGSNLPSLTELRCIDSYVMCVRDLGTGLGRLTVLWLSNCGLKDLDGLPSLTSLEVQLKLSVYYTCYNIVIIHIQELYISHNSVNDISVAAMMTNLKVLDLEWYITVIHNFIDTNDIT